MEPTMLTVAGVSLFGMALAEMLANRKLTGNDWPNSVPEHWPQEWRTKFANYRPATFRGRATREIKKQVLDLCKKKNREKVKGFMWVTRDRTQVAVGDMSWSHLVNTIRYCYRKANWGPWVYFVAEHRLRLAEARRKTGEPTSKLTISTYDLKWEKAKLKREEARAHTDYYGFLGAGEAEFFDRY